MNYRKAAKTPPATAAKLMPMVAAPAAETIGAEPVEVLLPPPVPVAVADPDPDPDPVELGVVVLAIAGSMVAL